MAGWGLLVGDVRLHNCAWLVRTNVCPFIYHLFQNSAQFAHIAFDIKFTLYKLNIFFALDKIVFIQFDARIYFAIIAAVRKKRNSPEYAKWL